ncbi:MAG: ribonuclease HII [Candidatus Woesearchaeota archaeon]|jgi:ribonuclease HII
MIGVDEAGRGPVIGPLIMCGVSATPEMEKELIKIGVKDSKKLSPKQRVEMAAQIRALPLTFKIVSVSHTEIDLYMGRGTSLNTIEAIATAQIIDAIKDDVIMLDCPSSNPSSYVSDIRRRIGNKEVQISAEYKADENYPIVSAASILAKVERDSIIEKMREEVGIDFGSGYPSDPKTKAFVKHYFDKYDVFRTQWETYKHAKTIAAQQTLGDF